MVKLKALIIVITICLISITSFAQHKKGDISFGIGTNLDILGLFGPGLLESEMQYAYIYPQFNYFVNKKLSIGLEIPFEFAKHNEIIFKVMPFLKYYMGKKKHKTFLKPSLGFSFDKEHRYLSDYISANFSYELRFGRSYLINNKTRWEISIGFEMTIFNKSYNKSRQYATFGLGLFF